MKMYIGHSKEIDFINNVYKPVRNDTFFDKYEIILPHEDSLDSTNTRDFYKNIDIFIFECSLPATGLGIELGWAYDDNKKIYVIYKKECKLSNSIKAVTDNIYEYSSTDDMIEYIKKVILDNE